MLGEILRGKIQIIDEVKNWSESIKIASKPLLDNNIIEERYIEAMINAINKMGFFVVLRENLAMPHARPEEGTLDTGVSFLKVNKPVKYGDEDIYLIFILASKDMESHISILMELSDLFQNDEKINKLIEAKKIEELEKIINS